MGGGCLLGVIQPADVGKMGVVHPQRLGFLIHEGNKPLLRPADVDGQGQGCLPARGEQCPIDEVNGPRMLTWQEAC